MNGGTCEAGSWQEPGTGRVFAYRFWRAEPAKALLILVHGFGEHGQRYDPLARAFMEQGISVGVPDLWGHGRSGGARGDSPSVAQYVDDCEAITRQVFLPAAGRRRYAIFGHSFGGLVAILWALRGCEGLTSAVIQSPLLEAGFPVPILKVLAARVMAVCWPACPFRLNLDATALSHDPEVIAAYQADPLVHNIMTARAYQAILRARDEAMAHAAAMRVPSLLLCGSEDRIVSVAYASRWFERLTCQKRQMVFPGGYHELHHEPVRGEVFRLTSEWTLSHG